MSSSSVCQGLQSCVTEPRFLLMKLAPPLELPPLSQSETRPLTPPNTTCEKDLKQDKNPNADMGGWAFLQSLCNKTDKTETEKIYIHPLVKRSCSSLSAKSLKMCTESLGCETGSDGSESSDDITLFSLEGNTPPSLATAESDRICVSKRSNRSVSNFPPPLSSMSQKGGVQVRPRREDGRLILEVVPTPSHPSCFKAERSNGRLTLQLCDEFKSVEADEEEKEERTEEEGDDTDEVEEYWDENNENDEDGTGMRKIPRPSRCNENWNMSNQMLDWEPLW